MISIMKLIAVTMNNTVLSILSFLFIFIAGPSYSQSVSLASDNNQTARDSVIFKFRQGRHNLDPEFSDNKTQLSRLQNLLNSSDSSDRRIRQISIQGTASPEGSVELNRRLSESRAREILNLFPNTINNESLIVSSTGRDWKGLARMAKDDMQIPDYTLTLRTINDIVITDSLSNGERPDAHNLEHLEAIAGGVPYTFLYNRIFPRLRTTRVYFDFSSPIIPDNIPMPGLNTDVEVPVIGPLPISMWRMPETKKPFYMSVKTNLLYDAAALPTLGIEFYLGKDFSIAGEWTYGWWDNDNRHRYWRDYGGDLSLRWWFGKAAHEKPLTGHHIGIYGGITTFDFEFGNKGYMGGIPGATLWDRSLRMAGIEYGYSLPIASRLNLDFTIGIGYLGGKYIKYVPVDNGYLWQSVHNLKWFGPTKAEISLVWLLGRGNKNIRKGDDL